MPDSPRHLKSDGGEPIRKLVDPKFDSRREVNSLTSSPHADMHARTSHTANSDALMTPPASTRLPTGGTVGNYSFPGEKKKEAGKIDLTLSPPASPPRPSGRPRDLPNSPARDANGLLHITSRPMMDLPSEELSEEEIWDNPFKPKPKRLEASTIPSAIDPRLQGSSKAIDPRLQTRLQTSSSAKKGKSSSLFRGLEEEEDVGDFNEEDEEDDDEVDLLVFEVLVLVLIESVRTSFGSR